MGPPGRAAGAPQPRLPRPAHHVVARPPPRRARRALRAGRHPDPLRRRPAPDPHRLRARARRRRPRHARLPAHHVRVGAAPLRAGRPTGSSSEPASASTALHGRAATRQRRPSPASCSSDGRRSTPTSPSSPPGGGRPLPDWLAALGVGPVDEEAEDTGIVYFSRFYRLRDGRRPPPRGRWRSAATSATSSTASSSATTARSRSPWPTRSTTTNCAGRSPTPSRSRPARAAGRRTAPWLDGRAEPITDQVHVMAGLLNRWREYVVDGRPLALGVFPIGDALHVHQPALRAGLLDRRSGRAHLLGDGPRRQPRRPVGPGAGLRRGGADRVATRGTARRCCKTPRPGGSPPRCSPARTPTATRPTRARSCAACCATGWCRRCASTRSCCGPSCATSTC